MTAGNFLAAMRRILKLSLILFFAAVPLLHGQPPDGALVRGADFEGVICNPKMFQLTGDIVSAPMGQHIAWTPSPALILQAERDLPAAAKKMTTPRSQQPNFPKFYTAKCGSAGSGNRAKDFVPEEDSDTDFISDVARRLPEYKRQYIGLTIHGKRVLLMSFIYKEAIESNPPYLPYWKHEWVEVLDGGDGFWRVIYDPSTRAFSDWQCNGEA